MKTPLDPPTKDLAVALGKEARRRRDDGRRTARAGPVHLCADSGGATNGTETLALIERALFRLASGTYGLCLSCGSDISLTRLDQNPAVETCKSCSDAVHFKAH